MIEKLYKLLSQVSPPGNYQWYYGPAPTPVENIRPQIDEFLIQLFFYVLLPISAIILITHFFTKKNRPKK